MCISLHGQTTKPSGKQATTNKQDEYENTNAFVNGTTHPLTGCSCSLRVFQKEPNLAVDISFSENETRKKRVAQSCITPSTRYVP